MAKRERRRVAAGAPKALCALRYCRENASRKDAIYG